MSETEISSRLNDVFNDVFDRDEPVVLTRETVADDVEGWDSLTHINLIYAVEKSFKIKFTTREIAGLKNVGDLMDLIARKTA